MKVAEFCVVSFAVILRYLGVVDGALSTIVESGAEECYVFRTPTTTGENFVIR
jgi:hypothetical protein